MHYFNPSKAYTATLRACLFVLLTVLLFTQCRVTRPPAVETAEAKVQLYFSYASLVQNEPHLYFELTNELPDTIVILRPYPVVENYRFPPASVPPDFFNLSLFPQKALCEYPPFDSGTNAVKSPKDFLILAPGDHHTLEVDPDHYFQGICDKNYDSVRGVLRYQYDSRYIEDEAFFNARIKRKGRLDDEASEELLALLRRCYRGGIVSDTFTLNLEGFRY